VTLSSRILYRLMERLFSFFECLRPLSHTVNGKLGFALVHDLLNRRKCQCTPAKSRPFDLPGRASCCRKPESHNCLGKAVQHRALRLRHQRNARCLLEPSKDANSTVSGEGQRAAVVTMGPDITQHAPANERTRWQSLAAQLSEIGAAGAFTAQEQA